MFWSVLLRPGQKAVMLTPSGHCSAAVLRRRSAVPFVLLPRERSNTQNTRLHVDYALICVVDWEIFAGDLIFLA